MSGVEVASLFAKLGLVPDEQQWARGDQLISGMKKAAVGLAAAFGVHEITKWIGETVEAGQYAQKMGEQLGISAESASELAYVAKRSETDLESLSTALSHVAHSLTGELAAGTGPTLTALNKLGIGTEQVKKVMSGPGGADDLIGMVSDKIAAMEPGLNKAGVASEIFGARMGAKLIPFLDNGADGIARLRSEAHELGQTFTQDQADQYDTISENWGRVKDGFAGVRNEIVSALAPSLKDASEYVVGVLKDIIAWVRSHKDEIGAFFHAFGETVVAIFHGIKVAVQVAWAVIEAVYDIIATVIRAFVDVGTFVYEKVLKPIAEFGVWLWGWVIKLFGYLVQAFNWLADKASSFFQAIYNLGRRIVDFFVEVGQTIRQTFEDAFNYVANLPIVKQIRQAIEDYKHLHGDTAADDAYDQYIQNASNEDVGGRGNFVGTISRDEFNAQREARMAALRAGAAGGPAAGAAPVAGGSVNTVNTGTVQNNVNLGGITVNAGATSDPDKLAKTLQPHIENHVRNAMDQTYAAAAATVASTPKGQ